MLEALLGKKIIRCRPMLINGHLDRSFLDEYVVLKAINYGNMVVEHELLGEIVMPPDEHWIELPAGWDEQYGGYYGKKDIILDRTEYGHQLCTNAFGTVRIRFIERDKN